MFRNEHMDKFAGKPKIFFIQACQGNANQSHVDCDEADDVAKEPSKEDMDKSDVLVAIPNDADVLLAYATTPVFRKFKEQCHLEDMMVTVRERAALKWIKLETGKVKQMPYTWSTLTKRLRLK